MLNDKYCEFFGMVLDGNSCLWLLEKEMPKEFYLDPILGESEGFYVEYRKPYISQLICADHKQIEAIKDCQWE